MADPKRRIDLPPVTIVDVSSERERRAREMGAHAMTMETKEADSLTSVPEKMWKHNALREYYRQKEIATARGRIRHSGDVLTPLGESGTSDAAKEAELALITRFSSKEDEFLHTEAGEARRTLGIAGKEGQFKIQIGNLFKDFVQHGWSDAEFERAKAPYLALLAGFGKGSVDAGELYVDNMLEVAHEARRIVGVATALDRIEFNTEVTIGRARVGARTETEYSRVDRVMEKVNRSPLKPFQKGIAQALGAMESVLAFTPLGQSEKERVAMERQQHARDRAVGKDFDPGDKRRLDLERTLPEKKTSKELMDAVYAELQMSAPARLANPSRETFIRLARAKAELDSRIYLSDKGKRDRITYESGDVEGTRLEMDATSLRAREALRNIPDADLIAWTGDTSAEPDKLTKYLSDISNDIDRELLGADARAQEAARQLPGATTLGVRRPLGPALNPDEAEDRRRAAARTLPPPVRPAPAPPVRPAPPAAPGTPEPARPDAAPRPPEEPPVVESAATRGRRDFSAGLSRFAAETGFVFGPVRGTAHADRQKIVRAEYEGHLTTIPDVAFIEDLMRLTGEDFDEPTLQRLEKHKNVAVLAALVRLHPERAANIPWATAIATLERDVVDHSAPNKDSDVWILDLARLPAAGKLDVSKAEDGQKLVDFVKGFGPLFLEENFQAFLAWDKARAEDNDLANLDATTKADLTDLFGEATLAMGRDGFRRRVREELNAKFDALLAGNALPATTNPLEIEWNDALTKRFQQIRQEPMFVKADERLSTILEIAKADAAELAERFTLIKGWMVAELGEEIGELEKQLEEATGVPEQTKLTRQLDILRARQATLTAADLGPDTATWDATLRTLAAAKIPGKDWNIFMGSLYLATHQAERPADAASPADHLLYVQSQIIRLGDGGAANADLYTQLSKSFGFDRKGEHALYIAERQLANLGQKRIPFHPSFEPSREMMRALLPEQEEIALQEHTEDLATIIRVERANGMQAEGDLRLEAAMVKGTLAQIKQLREAGNWRGAYELLARVDVLSLELEENIREKVEILEAKAREAEAARERRKAGPAAGPIIPGTARAPGTPPPDAAKVASGVDAMMAALAGKPAPKAAPAAASPATATPGPTSTSPDAKAAGDALAALLAGTGGTSKKAPAASTPDTKAAPAPGPTPDAAAPAPAPTPDAAAAGASLAALLAGTASGPPDAAKAAPAPTPDAAPAPAAAKPAPKAAPAAATATPGPTSAKPDARVAGDALAAMLAGGPGKATRAPAAEAAPATPVEKVAIPTSINRKELKGFPEQIAVDALTELKKEGRVTIADIQRLSLRSGDAIEPSKAEAFLTLLAKKGIVVQSAKNKAKPWDYVPGSLDAPPATTPDAQPAPEAAPAGPVAATPETPAVETAAPPTGSVDPQAAAQAVRDRLKKRKT